MVFTSAILLIGRRQVGEEAARAASAEGSPLLLPISFSVLEVTSDCCCCSAMVSTLTVGGGDATLGGTGGGDCGLGAIGGGTEAGDGCLGVAPRFLVAGRGVAGVVERTGIEIFDGAGVCSSLLGGGGSIPWPGCGLAAIGRDRAISPAAAVSGADGVGALRLMTFGGELTPATSGEGSSAWTTVSPDFSSTFFTGSG